VKLRSFRHCITYPRQRQLGRQPKNSKALLSQPSVTVFVGKALLLDFMAWTVNFDNQSMFAADEIKDSVAQGSLPLKLGAVASPVANCAPNKCLGLNGPRAMLARETAEYGAGTSSGMAVTIRGILRVLNIPSRRAPRDPPHPSLLRNDTFPRKGGRDARAVRGATFSRCGRRGQPEETPDTVAPLISVTIRLDGADYDKSEKSPSKRDRQRRRASLTDHRQITVAALVCTSANWGPSNPRAARSR